MDSIPTNFFQCDDRVHCPHVCQASGLLTQLEQGKWKTLCVLVGVHWTRSISKSTSAEGDI
jgi:hypothetical protein